MHHSRARRPAAVMLAALVAISSGLAGARPVHAAPAGSAPAGSAPAGSVPADRLRESILVSGTGDVLGEPDTLTAAFAVETSAATVGEALTGAGAAATRMRDALAGAGLTKADLQTSSAEISAKRNDDGKITGYTANQGLTVTIRNLSRAGAQLSAAITAGGDAARLNSASFAIEDDRALLAEARKKAFADARAKAELYAREARRPLGRVVKVSEENPGFGYGSAKHYSMAAVADAAVPIEPGRQRLSVTVTVEWLLGGVSKAGASR